VNISPENVLKAFEKCENYTKLFPGIKKARRLSNSSCYLEGDTPEFWLQISIKTFRISPNSYLVKSKMIRGYPTSFESEAFIEATNLRSQSKVHLGMKSTINGFPQIVLDRLLKSVTRRTLENLVKQH